ncbi:MAG: hypothetical protein H7Y18_08285 [Clostridiaceae bacterium]|nr:hypothetical protein [Clostridiaceae bacterium]
MLKLIKYELRGNLLTILGICITVMVANLLLITRKAAWETDVIIGASICLSIVAITIIFISALNLMSKYLYNDTGYLLFTLPQSGMKIMLSKLLTALIQITLVIVVTSLGVCFTLGSPLDFSFFNYITVKGILVFTFIYIWMTISLLSFIYFSMVMGKVALRNKKLGKIGSFIIFILLSVALFWIESKLTGIFPQTINFDISSLFKNSDLINNNLDSISKITISNLIFEILTFAAIFIGTTYMIDNKLDL